MVLIRAAPKIAKPLWYSAAARYSAVSQSRYTPGWSTLGDLSRTKRGIFGRCMKQKDPLASFIGTWYETESTNFDEYLRQQGHSEVLITGAMKLKSWNTFARDDDNWLFYFGVAHKPTYGSSRFTLGEYFYDIYFNGDQMKGLAFQRDEVFVQKFESCTDPLVHYEIERKMKSKNKHICKIMFNGVVTTLTYKRILSDDEHREKIGIIL